MPPSVIRIFSAWSSMSASSNIRVPPMNHTILKYVTRNIFIKLCIKIKFLILMCSHCACQLTSTFLATESIKISDKIQELIENHVPEQIIFP